ncbi:MAG TPA: hypothetical protein VHE35_23530 [Kofleriaceae bacterium]|nr:hypothetical protein [Kofleriaceae bacterium]
MQTVACARCAAKVPVGDTTFDEEGNYLCQRCTDVADVAATVERARQAALEKARSRAGGGLGGMIRRWFAVRRAEKEHAAFAATLPNLDGAPTKCGQCGASVPRGFARCDACRAKA